MWAFFAALPPGEFPHTVELAAQLARISTDDQFQFGIRTFLAGLNSGESLTASLTQSKQNKQPRSLTWADGARREGFEPPTARSVVWCSIR